MTNTEKFNAKTTRARFNALLRAAIDTKPLPLKDVPSKSYRKKRKTGEAKSRPFGSSRANAKTARPGT
jgi:hypothetical protein